MRDDNPRFIFSGHAIGASAQFHRLNDHDGKEISVNHVIPAKGATVLPPTGGLSRSVEEHFCYQVTEPRRRTLMAFRRIESTASGKEVNNRFETETESRIESLSFVGKLYIDLLHVHVLASRDPNQPAPVISTRGNRIEGMRLGDVDVRVHLDDEPLCSAANHEQLAHFYKRQSHEYRRVHSWRYSVGPDVEELPASRPYHVVTLVREIELGEGRDRDKIHVKGNVIHFEGFGRIYLGEVIVKKQDRQVTLIRLKMGSDAAGTASAGDGQSNGQLPPPPPPGT